MRRRYHKKRSFKRNNKRHYGRFKRVILKRRRGGYR